MGLSKSKLRTIIWQSDLKNDEGMYGQSSVVGLSTQKQIITTQADLSDVDLCSYKLFQPGQFAYIPDTSRRGNKVSLAYNSTKKIYLVSSISIVFGVKDTSRLLSDYLFMYFNRLEFDRYARFNSWGSARETFSWDDMCDMDIDLPDLPTQQKYVDIYLSMLENQKCYERGLDDLKLVCDGYIEDLRRKIPSERIGPYLDESDCRNELGLGADAVRGLATNKEMILTKANLDDVELSNYKIVLPKEIAYVSDTSRRGDKIALGINRTKNALLVSSISTVFRTIANKLLPEYLMLFFTRFEFDRYARFHSWGSARETFTWDDLCDVKIPIPDIETQKAISEIYAVYNKRREINEKLKEQIKNICPILIKGSFEEGKNGGQY